MVRHEVEWVEDAQNELAQIYLDSSNPQAVTASASAIDHQLSRDPEHVGSPLAEGLRKLRVDPLEVIYSIVRPRTPSQLGCVEVALVRRA